MLSHVQPSKPIFRTGELAGGTPPRECGLRRAQTRPIFVELAHLLGLTTLQGELTGTRLLVILRLTAVSKRLVVNTMP